ncbi:hypothetical protein [Xanthomonas phaseoli]|uniref:hypothetical protein n=2 Tax=Xanthomonas phaseoli TaxID=1985254 RepID=UPI00126722C8|nr:hypothetical protein [Xanthomonas phaseoli]
MQLLSQGERCLHKIALKAVAAMQACSATTCSARSTASLSDQPDDTLIGRMTIVLSVGQEMGRAACVGGAPRRFSDLQPHVAERVGSDHLRPNPIKPLQKACWAGFLSMFP